VSRLRIGAGMNRIALRRAILRAAFCAVVCAFVSAVDAAETTLGAAEWSAIRKVISQQLAALKRGQGERAFGYASEGIRTQFGDAESFLAMVRTSYAPLLEARYTEFLEGAVIDGVIVQPLRLIAPDNTVRVALYTMERHKGRWRINGCAIAPSTVKAA
jgi:hypothetical protein